MHLDKLIKKNKEKKYVKKNSCHKLFFEEREKLHIKRTDSKQALEELESIMHF